MGAPEDIVSYFALDSETVEGPDGGRLTRHRHMLEMKKMGAEAIRFTEVARGPWRGAVLVLQGWLTTPAEPAPADISRFRDMREMPPRWRYDPAVGSFPGTVT